MLASDLCMRECEDDRCRVTSNAFAVCETVSCQVCRVGMSCIAQVLNHASRKVAFEIVCFLFFPKAHLWSTPSLNPKGGPHLRAKHWKTEGSVSGRQEVCVSTRTVFDSCLRPSKTRPLV